MNWQIFVAINVVCIAISSLLQKVLLRKHAINPVAFAGGSQVMMGIFIGIALLFKGFHLPNLAPIAINLALMPVLYAFGNIAKYRALKKVEVSEFTVLYQVSAFVSVLVAITFLGETFRLAEILGLVIIVAAILLIATQEHIKFKLGSGGTWALFSAVFMGVAFTNDAYILRSFDVWSYAFLSCILSGLLMLAFLGKEIGSLKHLADKNSFVVFLLSSFIFAIAILSTQYAYQLGRNAAQISSIMPTASILIVILAAIFLKERGHVPRKLFAAVLAVVGIALLN